MNQTLNAKQPALRERPVGITTALLAMFVLSACGDDAVAPEADVPLVDLDTSSDAGDTTTPDVGAPDTVDDASVPDVVEDTAPDSDDTSDTTPDADEDVDAETDIEIPDPPPVRCEAPADCNDGLTCTTDRCGDEGVCEWTVRAGTCLIGGACRDAGYTSPASSCAACVPTENPFGYSTLSDGTGCDDGNACTLADACTAGVCGGTELSCDDDNACTTNACDSELGCVFPPVLDGAECDDNNACTQNNTCIRGVCRGDAVRCNDGNACTDDTCDPETGCEAINHDRACSDGDACTSGDVCVDGSCVPAGPTDCDDGNACTIEICDEFAGCTYVPSLSPCCTGSVSICDDGNPCTTDLCDAETLGCAYENNTVSCTDGNACTSGDRCSEGECAAGAPTVCNDGNDCTEDFCRPDSGCSATAVSGVACEDGDECTSDDLCNAGVCTSGAVTCVCEPEFGLDAVVFTTIAIGSGGRTGQALNLDNNATTCAPAGDCSGGIDNALGILATFANDPLAEALAGGSLSLLLDLDNIARNPFQASLYTGDLATPDVPCDPATETCAYTVSRGSFDATCTPQILLPATRAGSLVFAGGPSSVFPLEVPFGDGATLTLTLFQVRFEGTLTLEGDRIVSLEGVIGGAVRKTDLIAALNAIPPESLPLDPAAIISALNALVATDIDTNGDGTPDASSIGLRVSGRRASIVGTTE